MKETPENIMALIALFLLEFTFLITKVFGQ